MTFHWLAFWCNHQVRMDCRYHFPPGTCLMLISWWNSHAIPQMFVHCWERTVGSRSEAVASLGLVWNITLTTGAPIVLPEWSLHDPSQPRIWTGLLPWFLGPVRSGGSSGRHPKDAANRWRTTPLNEWKIHLLWLWMIGHGMSWVLMVGDVFLKVSDAWSWLWMVEWWLFLVDHGYKWLMIMPTITMTMNIDNEYRRLIVIKGSW